MTGQELLAGLSFVDERYIAEAETARLGRNMPWMKILSVAACLCILMVGALALGEFGHKGAMEEAAAPAAPQAMPEAAPEEAPMQDRETSEEAAPREEEVEAEAAPEPPAVVEEDPIPAGELQHISYARLRVTNLNEDGSFEAIVEEISVAPRPFEVGLEVTVIVDPTKVPGADAEVQNDLKILHTDAQIEIEDGAYDAGMNILYVAEVVFLCRGDH